MADGFLSPEGVFYPKEETYHAETARRILHAGKDVLEPIQELLRLGYIAFIEFRNPLAKESLRPDLDYVLCSHGHTLTPAQERWLREHTGEISRRQKYYINKDDSYAFRQLELGNVNMYAWCGQCEVQAERLKWCNAETNKPRALCAKCPYREIPE